MKIISIINQKGGAGKTTTAINFASGLAMEGKQVLLIDLDPQANATIGLGIVPSDYYDSGIQSVLLKKKNIQEVIIQTKINNLFIIPAHLHLDKVETQLTPELFRETFLFKAINNLTYDFIVIDCRPTLGLLSTNAVYASDIFIVPCEMSRFALDGFNDLLETIDHVKNGNVNNKNIHILLTKYDSRNKVSNDWVMQQLEPYKDIILTTRIRKSEPLNQAHMSQEPVFTFKSDSTGAQDYKQLTEEFLNLCQ